MKGIKYIVLCFIFLFVFEKSIYAQTIEHYREHCKSVFDLLGIESFLKIKKKKFLYSTRNIKNKTQPSLIKDGFYKNSIIPLFKYSDIKYYKDGDVNYVRIYSDDVRVTVSIIDSSIREDIAHILPKKYYIYSYEKTIFTYFKNLIGKTRWNDKCTSSTLRNNIDLMLASDLSSIAGKYVDILHNIDSVLTFDDSPGSVIFIFENKKKLDSNVLVFITAKKSKLDEIVKMYKTIDSTKEIQNKITTFKLPIPY